MLFGPLFEGGVGVWDREKRRGRPAAAAWRAFNNLRTRSRRADAIRRQQLLISRSREGRHRRARIRSVCCSTGGRRSATVRGMAWEPRSGQLLAVGGPSNDPRVYVWNVSSRDAGVGASGHTGAIVGAQFARTLGYLLATTGVGRHGLRLWDAAPGRAAGDRARVRPWAFHRMTTEWLFLLRGCEDRRAGRCGDGRGGSDAPPGHGRQPLRGAGRYRSDVRRLQP